MKTKNSTDALFVGGKLDGKRMDDPGIPVYVAWAMNTSGMLDTFRYNRTAIACGENRWVFYVPAGWTEGMVFGKLFRKLFNNYRPD